MYECSLDQLLGKARSLSKGNKKWHFHYMTPGCHFSKARKYVLILEQEHGPSLIAGSLTRPSAILEELERLTLGS